MKVKHGAGDFGMQWSELQCGAVSWFTTGITITYDGFFSVD